MLRKWNQLCYTPRGGILLGAGEGVRGTPYNSVYGEVRLKGVPFSSYRYVERQDFFRYMKDSYFKGPLIKTFQVASTLILLLIFCAVSRREKAGTNKDCCC